MNVIAFPDSGLKLDEWETLFVPDSKYQKEVREKFGKALVRRARADTLCDDGWRLFLSFPDALDEVRDLAREHFQRDMQET